MSEFFDGDCEDDLDGSSGFRGILVLREIFQVIFDEGS